MQTREYAPGRSVDVFGDSADPTILLWHGAQTDARRSVRTLAGLLADRGFGVVAPDWNSHADDRGASDLLASVAFARSWSSRPETLALVGWSLGGAAAAGLTIHASRYDAAVTHTVCLAGAFMAPDPISGDDLTAALAGRQGTVPLTLLHGLADDVVPPAASRTFAAALEKAGWPVRLIELDADHGSVAGARYDPATDSYAPADDPATLRAAGAVAEHIGRALAAVRRR